MTTRPKHKPLAICLLTILTMLISTTARADEKMLNMIPKDSSMFIAVPNLADLNDKIANLSESTGLAALAPETTNLLQIFKSESRLDTAMNDNGSLIFVVGTLTEDGPDEDTVFLMIPVTDYDAFIKAKDGNPKDEVAEIAMDEPGDAFARKVGDYALISPSADAVINYKAGDEGAALLKRAGALGKADLENADIFVYIDAAAVANFVGPKILDEMQRKMQQAVAEGLEGEEAVGTEQKMMQLAQTVLKTVEEEAEAFVLSAKVEPAGVLGSYSLGYKPGGKISEYLPGGKSQATAILADLPASPYLFAFATDTKAINMVKVVEFTANVMDDTMGDMMPGMGKLYRDAIPMIKNIDASASVLYPPNMMAQAMVNQVQIYKTKDSKKSLEDIKNYMAALGNIEFPQPGANQEEGMGGGEMSFQTTWRDNALELDGATVAQYSMTMVMPPEMMQQMGPMAMMMNPNYNGYIAAKGDYIVQTTSLDQAQLNAALNSLGKGGGLGAQPLLANIRNKFLPENPVMEGYISLGGIAEVANMWLPMMGAPPIAAPADLSPIAMGMGIQDNSTATVLFIPADNIKFVVDTVNTFQQMQQQGPGMGGPEGEPGQAPPAPYY
ncbi:hypothetical protein [Poriferisphaera sp. WC338]|uniref:hypothetical protein n=1 Tax=Poriferisphaera sp. WC338 TaxID=3425129 RepID=UPI003D819012